MLVWGLIRSNTHRRNGMKQNIVVNSSDALEVRDVDGNVLFSWDGSEPVQVNDEPEFDELCDVPVRNFASELREFPEVKEMVEAWDDLREYCTSTSSVVVTGYGKSTVGVKVLLGDLPSMCDEVELDVTKTAMLRHFLTFVQYNAVDIIFSREGDGLMRLVEGHLCDDWSRETFMDLAERALDNYGSNTKEKAFFKYVYESAPMEEFRKRFELAVSLLLNLRKDSSRGGEIVDYLDDVLRENTRLREDGISEVREYVLERFWGDLRGVPMLID